MASSLPEPAPKPLLQTCSVPQRPAQLLGEAGRDGGERPVVAGPVGARRLADKLGEPGAERAERRAADRHADLGHRQVAAPQQRLRPLDPPGHQVAVRALPVRGPELAGEVRRRHQRHPGQRGDVERLGVVPVHGVPGPAQQGDVLRLHHGAKHPTTRGALPPEDPPTLPTTRGALPPQDPPTLPTTRGALPPEDPPILPTPRGALPPEDPPILPTTRGAGGTARRGLRTASPRTTRARGKLSEARTRKAS